MADKDSKTEDPTARRLQKAREEGQVAKSQEINTIAVLLAAIFTLFFGAGHMWTHLSANMATTLGNLAQTTLEGPDVQYFFIRQLLDMAVIMAPVLIVIPAIGVLVNVWQVGFHFTAKPLEPKFEKLNFVSGLGRLVSVKSLMELAKSIFKIIIIFATAYYTVMGKLDTIVVLGDMPPAKIGYFVMALSFEIFIKTCWILAVLAIIDLLFQRWKFNEDMKMTKEEVKEDNKQADGDPMVKRRIRTVQMEQARKRMMGAVPEADVVVTNPTHFAVALLYDSKRADAPIVVAKGQNLVAEKIKAIAREHKIPIMEDKPLARALFRSVDIGDIIPAEFYKAVAEILSFVYRTKGKVVRG